MLRNYLKIAWRNLIKDRQFSFLNIIGLAAGIACTFLIYLWVQDELSVDKFLPNDDQVYQLMEHRKLDGDVKISDESSGMLAETLIADAPEVVYAAALAPPEWFQKFTLTVGDKNIKAIGQYAGKDYFNIFSLRILEGKPGQLLASKKSIAISDELAKRLFNKTENLIGIPIQFQHDQTFFVSGVFQKLPKNSSQQFDFVLSFEYYADVQPWVKNWNSTGPHNFALLRKGTDVATLNKKMAGLVQKNTGDTTRAAFAMKFSDNYIQNNFLHGSRTGGKLAYVRLFSVIAILILTIACINFMNLSTAKASRRMKEVGIKKVVGARRMQLILQFLSESVLITGLSMVLAIGIARLLLPEFNELTGKELSIRFSMPVITGILGITLFTGLLSGSYPALYLSKFNPLAVLKGKLQSSFGELLSRKGLVIFQFSLSIILIVSVMIIYQQIKFIQSADPGYNKDNIIRFDSEGSILGNQETFISGLKQIPGVVNASFTFNNMVGRNYGTDGLDWDGKDPNASIYFEGFGAGYDFLETMGMHLKEGRSFSRDFPNDADGSKIMINESAAAVMHLRDPIGKRIRMFGNTREIIGVVKNFHFESLHENVKPAYFIHIGSDKNSWYKIMVKIKGGGQKETIDRIQKYYEDYNPGFPFTYNFLDEAYQKQYETEMRVATLSKYFSGLAILISCLGLFGLAAFTAQKRQKEIGIRKVVGASVNSIAFLLSTDFLKLVGIAVLIAFPVSWWAMKTWLESFAYRIEMGYVVFLIAGASVILITMLTISFQAIKAALANPVSSLRSE